MRPEPKITKPVDPPMRYLTGGWPGGTDRSLSEAEGGELVHYQLKQLREFVAEPIKRRMNRARSQQASLAHDRAAP